MTLWVPPSLRKRVNVQLTGPEKIVVLVHRETRRILTFGFDDMLSRSMEACGYEKIEINHAHEYDKWMNRWREQAKQENEAEDYAYTMREDAARQALRKQLRERLRLTTEPRERRTIELVFASLEVMEARKKRYRAESFTAQEAFECSKNAGEELVNKIMLPK